MSANSISIAPPGRKKLARGKERSDAAPGHASQNTSSPERAKEGSWPVVPLGELAADERNSITDGPFGSKLKTEHYTAIGPRVVRLKNIGDAEFVDAKAHISDAHFLSLQKHRVFPGDIVIAALGENPPRSCLVPEFLGPAIVKADCIRFKAGQRVLPKFLNYVLNGPGLRRHAKGIIHGVGRPRLNLGEIKALPIPLPPLGEQQQIVAEIEKQFTRLDAGVSAFRRVQANLKRYRAAVLKAACEGKLVPTEAELQKSAGKAQKEFESGEQLLKRILAQRRQNWSGRGKYQEPAAPDTANLPSLPAGWTWATWGQIGLSQNGRPFKSAEYQPAGFKLLRPGNLHVSGKVVWNDDNTRRMPPKRADENADLIVRGGELVMNLTAQSLKDEFLGRVCLTSDEEECLLNQRLARLTPITVSPQFALYLLKAWRFRRYVDGLNSGSLIQHMFTSQLAEFTFPLPPLAEQTRIVAEVERRLSVIEELDSVVSASLQRATRLRQSVLQQAFSATL